MGTRPRLRTGQTDGGPRRLLTAYAALAACDTWLAGHPAPWARRVRHLTKPALMPVLTASLTRDPRATAAPLRRTTLVAEAAGWGGDVALLRHGTTPFLVGAGSFAAGHAAYLTGFVRHRDPTPYAAARGPRLVLGALLTTAPVVTALARRQDPALAPGVAAYAGSLAAMTAAALHLDPDLPRRPRVLTATGAVLFMVSDTVLAARTFTPGASEEPDGWERLVMATYTSAQLILRLGATA